MPRTTTTTTTRTTRSSRADFGDFYETVDPSFGDRRRGKRGGKHHHGDAAKRKLKRPYKRTVVRAGRKLVNKHRIGHVAKKRNEFGWLTRGGTAWAGTVSKGHKTARKAPKRKAAKKSARGRKK